MKGRRRTLTLFSPVCKIGFSIAGVVCLRQTIAFVPLPDIAWSDRHNKHGPVCLLPAGKTDYGNTFVNKLKAFGCIDVFS